MDAGGPGGIGGSVDGGGREVDGGKPAAVEETVSGELGGEMSNPAPFLGWLPGSGFHSGILDWTPLCYYRQFVCTCVCMFSL